MLVKIKQPKLVFSLYIWSFNPPFSLSLFLLCTWIQGSPATKHSTASKVICDYAAGRFLNGVRNFALPVAHACTCFEALLYRSVYQFFRVGFKHAGNVMTFTFSSSESLSKFISGLGFSLFSIMDLENGISWLSKKRLLWVPTGAVVQWSKPSRKGHNISKRMKSTVQTKKKKKQLQTT